MYHAYFLFTRIDTPAISYLYAREDVDEQAATEAAIRCFNNEWRGVPDVPPYSVDVYDLAVTPF